MTKHWLETMYVYAIIIRIISTDEDPSLRIESSAKINLRGVSTKLNTYKREFVWEFSQSGQTKTKVEWKMMGVGKREFVWEFSQLSCPCQTRTRVACMRVDESWQVIASMSFLNAHVLVKQGQEFHENWEARVFSTLVSSSNENKYFSQLFLHRNLDMLQ